MHGATKQSTHDGTVIIPGQSSEYIYRLDQGTSVGLERTGYVTVRLAQLARQMVEFTVRIASSFLKIRIVDIEQTYLCYHQALSVCS